MASIDFVAIMQNFKCPVCYDYMAPPFPQCIEGHNVCASCYRRVTSCPICRAKLCVVTNNILKEMYKMLQFPCPYEDCEELVPGNLRTRHMTTCTHRIIDCKICQWRGKASNFNQHFSQEHSKCVKLDLTTCCSFFFQMLEHQFMLDVLIVGCAVKIILNLVHGSANDFFYKLDIIFGDGEVIDSLSSHDSLRRLEKMQEIAKKGQLKYNLHVYRDNKYKDVFGNILL